MSVQMFSPRDRNRPRPAEPPLQPPPAPRPPWYNRRPAHVAFALLAFSAWVIVIYGIAFVLGAG